MHPILRASSVVLFGLAMSVQAGQPQTTTHRFRWVDGTGLPHYSDSLSVDALGYGYDVLDASGRVVRHVPPAVSASERNTLATSDKQAASAARREQQNRRLLMAYPTEEAFKQAQQARIDNMDDHIHTTRMNLDSQEQNLAQLLSHAADYTTRGKRVPHNLARRIAKQRQTVTAQRQKLKQQQNRKADLGKQIAAELVRYRDLQASQRARYGH